MSGVFIDNPILNAPFDAPTRHFQLTERGEPTGIVNPGRRRSAYIVPIPAAKKRTAQQATLDLDDAGQELTENDFINQIRGYVDAWRALPPSQWGVSHETERLLKHWRDPAREQRFFFCQLEAVETAIWLAEVAPKNRTTAFIDAKLETANAEANPDLFRIAFKMATGSGKTTVMAMLIAWQAVNKAARSRSDRFTDAFLIICPGITIRDRLRVLLPSDPENYYETRNLVPNDMLDYVRKARIVITNYHAFKLRETLSAPKLTKEILKGRGKAPQTVESEGVMLQRVCKPLLGRSNVIVINDEAHHCYRENVKAAEQRKLDAEEKEEAERNAAAARLWISGIEALNRALRKKGRDGRVTGGVSAVYDLSATPFFLRGSGYREGALFPWVVSDFSLMDAIEAGIVKVPRVPVSDNQVGGQLPVYRELYKHISDDLPKKGRAKQKQKEGGLDPEKLPPQLYGALTALYDHYRRTFELWQQSGHGTPPVFIVVCNNTSTSKLVYDYISGYALEESGQTVLKPGALDLFSNVENAKWRTRPRSLLIDSEQLDSGETLTPEFKKAASVEIDAFKKEIRERDPGRDVEKLTDEDILREVMNTVGKPGRLGEHIRCVVSVSMLTEGWDANTVTHILGIRAFGTQLLCEQVVGRGLRRVSYDPIKEGERAGQFEPEYADILGIPFTFVAGGNNVAPQPPKKTTRIRWMEDRPDHVHIRFPRVSGYRVILPSDRLTPVFTKDSTLTLDPDIAPSRVENAAIVGESITLSLDSLKQRRETEVAFHVAGHALRTRFRDEDGALKPFLFPQLLTITKRWMADHLECKGGAFPQYLLWRPLADMAVEKIYTACVPSTAGVEQLRPILDAYNREGSTRHVDFQTSKQDLWPTAADKCHINFVVSDSGWETGVAQALEGTPQVIAYVKNHNLGFEVPYVFMGEERRYRPDFIVRLDDGQGRDNPLNLVLEVKGFRGPDAAVKADTMQKLWVPAVNNVGAFGRWAFAEVTGKYDVSQVVGAFMTMPLSY